MQGPVTLVSSRVMLRARANRLDRSSSTLPERNAPGRCVKRVYASARPFRHYTIRRWQLPIGSAGSEFSRRARPAPASAFFFETSIWSDAFRWMTRRGTRSVNMIKGVDDRFFLFFFSTVVTVQGEWLITYRSLYFMREGGINTNRLVLTFPFESIRFARVGFIISGYNRWIIAFSVCRGIRIFWIKIEQSIRTLYRTHIVYV